MGAFVGSVTLLGVKEFLTAEPTHRKGRRAAAAPRDLGRHALLVTIGAMVANAAAYLVHLPASRWLGPELYGEFAALLSVQLIAAVPSLALQVVVARDRVLGASVARLRRTARRSAVALALVLAVAVWPVSLLLTTPAVTVIVAVISAPLLCFYAAELGLLQADNHFARFAVLSALLGIAQAVPSVLALAATSAVLPTLAGDAVGTAAVALVARVVVSRVDLAVPRTDLVDVPPRTDVWSVVHAAQVQLALIALTTTDLLLARSLLEPAEAGHYALGSIATKVAFWLPAAVATVLFPKMARPSEHAAARRTAVLLVSAIGAALAGAAAAAAPLVPLVVGDSYRPVAGWLWLFTVLGSLQSLLQVVLLAGIAAHRTRESAVAWIGVVLVASVPVGVFLIGGVSAEVRGALLSVPGLLSWAVLSLVLTCVLAMLTTTTRHR